MLPSRCSQPACRNIAVSADTAGIFSTLVTGQAKRRPSEVSTTVWLGGSVSLVISSRGIAAYSRKNAS